MQPSQPGSSRPIYRSRFAVLVFFLVVVDALFLAWVYQRTQRKPEQEPLKVARFHPQGESPPRQEISVTFTRDAIPAAPDIVPPVADGLLRLVPDVPGRTSWRSPRQLVFVPSRDLPRATPFQVLLSERIGEEMDTQLEGQRQYSFWTEPLELKRASQVRFTRDLRATIRLEFNDTVEPGDLKAHLELQNREGKEIPFQLATRVKAHRLDLQTQTGVSDVTVVMKPGLRGSSGPLGLEHEHRVPVALSYRLRVVSLSATQVFTGWPEIHVRFNNPIDDDAEDLESYFQVEPAVPFTATILGWRDSEVALRGEFRPGERYRVTMRKGLPGRPEAVLVEDTTREVAVPERRGGITFRESGGFLTPRGNRRVLLQSANVGEVRVAARRVLPNNLVHYLNFGSYNHFLRRGDWHRLELHAPQNEVVESAIDLRDIVGEDVRGIWYLEARTSGYHADDSQVVVATDLGLTIKTTADGFLTWVTFLRTGAPVPRARVTLWSEKNQNLTTVWTDRHGLAFLEGPFAGPDGNPYLVTAESKGDLSYLKLDRVMSRADFDVGGRPYLDRGYEAFVYSDRGVYRPGESAHLEAIVRSATLEEPGEFPVEVEVLRPDRKRFRLLKGVLGTEGSVSLEVDIPPTARTGRYEAVLQLPGGDGEKLGSSTFLVEEFMPQRIRAQVRVDDTKLADPSDLPGSPRRLRCGDKLKVLVSGEYLAGLPAAGARGGVEWTLNASTYDHPRWKDYHFGDSTAPFEELSGSVGSQELDAEGRAQFEIEIPEARKGLPLNLRVRATVKEVSGRPVYAGCETTVDSAPVYLGLRAGFEGNPRVQEPTSFLCAAVRPDGTPSSLAGFELTVHRLDWSSVLKRNSDGAYRYESHLEEKEVDKRRVELSDGQGDFSVAFARPGNYKLTLLDPASGTVTAKKLWVAGAGWSSSYSMEKPERLEIFPAPGLYRPGSTARVTVQAPFAGTLLLTAETDRVLGSQVTEMDGNQVEVEFSLPEHVAGNIYLAASVVRGIDPGEEKWLPHRAYGIVPLALDRAEEHLVVTVDAPLELRPKSRGTLRVRVAGEDGYPLPAQVSVAVVDEGILARTGYVTPDPWSFFYAKRAHAVPLRDVYGRLLPEVSLDVRRARPGGGDSGSADFGGKYLSPVKARRVQTVALWLGTRRTDDKGQLLYEFELPPFTGELRVMAIAHAAHRFGSGEKPVRVRSPLHLELGMPRFVAPGDSFVSEAQLFNSTGTDGQAEVEWRFDGPLGEAGPGVAELAFTSFSERSVEMGDGATKKLSFRLAARNEIGAARATVTAALGEEAIEETVELPVRPPAPKVNRVRSGTVTSTEPLALEIASDYVPGTGQQRLVLSGLPAVELLGALRYLIRYPHGCLEQTTSRVFPLVYLRDLGALLKGGYGEMAKDADLGDAEEDIDYFVEVGIDRLLSMQGLGGWLAMWPGGGHPWRWGSVYAAHFLVEARQAGHAVPDIELDALLGYLEEDLVKRPARDVTLLERCYALFVLALAGRNEVAGSSVEALLVEDAERKKRNAKRPAALSTKVGQKPSREQVASLRPSGGRFRALRVSAPQASATKLEEELSAEARCLLGAAWIRLGRPEEAVKILGDELPPPSEVRDLGGALRSPAREVALRLSATLDADPTSPRVPVLLEQLRGYRVAGRWGTTQENSFALLALGKYARSQRTQPANFTATVWLGGQEPVQVNAGEQRVFAGDFSGQSLRIDVSGDGRLYWHLHEEGVPVDGVDEVDSGMTVRRRYLSASGEDLTGKTLPWGEVVQVEIQLKSSRALENLIVSDLLPAGLEVENPRLGGKSVGQNAYYQSPAHLDIRDDRVLLYWNLPRSGTAVYRYAARAVTRGDFALPAVAAECMYSPGIYSRHGAGRVTVE